ncbi:L-2-amino-thiazoline-4-carboxylic acid hydrolase [Methanococcoides sp. SA1]|nr:L-2-amino-thiazoline-4-carboxylic acid hydrolase [Methanococcoides sp. SA1]
MKVEELSQFGKALTMPKEGIKKQEKIVFKLIYKEFGIIGMPGLIIKLFKEYNRIKKQFPEVMEYAKKIGLDKQTCMMGGLFFTITAKRNREFAKVFITNLIQEVATVSIPAIYQVPELVKCEGDTFDNYKKFNRAMFETIDKMGVWKNDGFNETDDLLEFKVTSCANIEIFKKIGCPELSTIGCDHDLAGYPLINDITNSEFRRPCTLAKGDDCCHFHFYRKGTAPNVSFENK